MVRVRNDMLEMINGLEVRVTLGIESVGRYRREG